MARNGSGTYSLPAGNPVVTGTTISSTTHNTTMNDIRDEITNSVAVDGQSTMTGALKMGSQKITGLANSTTRTGVPSVAQIQDGGLIAIGSVAGTNTITGSVSPAITAYATNSFFTIIPTADNTGATTINLNALGAKNIFSQGAACVGGELQISVPMILLYDGTQFNIVGNVDTIPAITFSNTVKGPFITKNVIAAHDNLVITLNSVTPDEQVDIDADAVLLENSSENIYKATSVNLTIDTASSGAANQLDTGAIAADTWYYFHVIYNGTTVAGLASLSSSSPTIPSGYTYSAYVGAGLTDATSDFINFKQVNKRASLNVPILDINASGFGATSATAAVTVPPNAIGEFGAIHTNSVSSYMLVTEIDQADTTPTSTLSDLSSNGSTFNSWINLTRRVDSSSEIRYAIDTIAGTETFRLHTKGWNFE